MKKIMSVILVLIMCLGCFSFVTAKESNKINLPSTEEREALIEGILDGTIDVKNEDPDNPVTKSLLKNSSVWSSDTVDKQEMELYDREIITDVRKIRDATNNSNETVYLSTIIYKDTYLVKNNQGNSMAKGTDEYDFVDVSMSFNATFTKIYTYFDINKGWKAYAYKFMDGYGGWIKTNDPQMKCTKIELKCKGSGHCVTTVGGSVLIKSESKNKTVNSPQKGSLYSITGPQTYYYFQGVDDYTGVGLRMKFCLKRTVSSYTYEDFLDDWRGENLFESPI